MPSNMMRIIFHGFLIVHGPVLATQQRSSAFGTYVSQATKKGVCGQTSPLAPYYKERVSIIQIALKKSIKDRNIILFLHEVEPSATQELLTSGVAIT